MPEMHFINSPITVEYFCDECNCPVVHIERKIAAAENQGLFLHKCPLCEKQYEFKVKLPILKHLKVAPVMPSKWLLQDEDDAN